MPRVRRVPRLRFEWPPSAVWHLMTGFYISGGFPPETDRGTLRAAWGDLREHVEAALVVARVRGRGGPYWRLRPWAWWEFDAPERRDFTVTEREQLDRLGLLDDAASEPAADPDDDPAGDDPDYSDGT